MSVFKSERARIGISLLYNWITMSLARQLVIFNYYRVHAVVMGYIGDSIIQQCAYEVMSSICYPPTYFVMGEYVMDL